MKETPTSLIYDNSLSIGARFTYVYIQSKPEGWELLAKPTADEIGCSEESLRKYINELISAGWLLKGEQKIEGGRFGAVKYTLLDCQRKKM